MRFMGILTVELAIEAVKRNGYALQYVKEYDLFVSIAAKLNITATL